MFTMVLTFSRIAVYHPHQFLMTLTIRRAAAPAAMYHRIRMSQNSPPSEESVLETVSGAALLVLDDAGKVQSLNSAATELLGAISGLRLQSLYAEGDRALREAERDGSVSISGIFRRQDGKLAPVEGLLTRTSGPRSGFLLLARDGTARRAMEQKLERTSAEMHEFAYRVSHDLKAPLRSVKSFCELLDRRYGTDADPEAREYVDFILTGAREMEQILGDLLAYSQAGRPDRTQPQATEAAVMIQWALMNVDPRVKATGAKITWDNSLPAVMVDQSQFASLLQHLFVNAIKFSKPGVAPLIHVSSVIDASADMVEFSVADNGTGIESGSLEQMFGVFKRMVGREIPGTGIGLAICRKIVEAHGGRIWLESEMGVGTTVKFTLPLA